MGSGLGPFRYVGSCAKAQLRFFLLRSLAGFREGVDNSPRVKITQRNSRNGHLYCRFSHLQVCVSIFRWVHCNSDEFFWFSIQNLIDQFRKSRTGPKFNEDSGPISIHVFDLGHKFNRTRHMGGQHLNGFPGVRRVDVSSAITEHFDVPVALLQPYALDFLRKRLFCALHVGCMESITDLQLHYFEALGA